MRKSRFFAGAVLAALLTVAGGSAFGHNVFVVTDPAELQLVDLRESYGAVNERLAERRDILSPIRNAAMRKMVDGWGLVRPSQGKLALGTVARVEDSGRLSFAVVLKGQIDSALTVKRLVEKHCNHVKRNGHTPQVSDVAQAGWKGARLPYLERDGVFTVLGKGGTLLVCSTSARDTGLVDEMITVLDGGRAGKASAPQAVNIRYHGAMTDRERGEVADFVARTLKGKVQNFRQGFQKLYAKIGGDVDEEDFKTVNERINDLFLKMVEFDVILSYEQGPSANEDLYRIHYAINLPSEDDAQSLKELLLEKAVFYRQNHPERGIESTLDAVKIDRDGTRLVVEGEVDSKEKQYDFIFAYTGFLLTYARADKYLGLKPW